MTENLEQIYLTMSYLVPGFIISSILLSRLSIKSEKENINLYNYLVFSFLNIFAYVLIDFLFIVLFGKVFVTNEHLIMLLRNLLLPLMLSGIIIHLFNKNASFRKVLSYLGLNRTNLTMSSWDYFFYELSNGPGSYLIIELKDKEELVYGWFGPQSFASNNFDGTKDIFLQETFKDASMIESRGCGMLICGSEILNVYNLIER